MCLGCIGVTGDYQDVYSVVEHNLFVNCDGDAEIIAIKSSNNAVRYNTIITSKGMLSSRAGNQNSIYGNYMLQGNKPGAGGIKIYEKDHKVYNNYIDGASEYPILIGGGDAYDGGSFAHAQVFRAMVVHNTIVNANNRPVIIGHGSNLPPVDSVFANNIVSGSASALVNQRLASNIVFSHNIAQGNLGFSAPADQFLMADPKFMNAGGLKKLSSGSPAINYANAGYSSFVTEDMDGQVRNAPDTGADEWSNDPIVRKPQQVPITPIRIDADLTSPIEAEDNSNAEGDFQTVDCSSCSGGAYMQLNRSPEAAEATSVLYRMNVTHGGPVYLHLLGSGSDTQQNAVLVSVDSGPDVRADVNPGGWGWTTAQSALSMADGIHDVSIKPLGSGIKLDKIAVSKSGRPPVEALLPKLDGIQINGNPVAGFSPTKYSYAIKLPFGTTGVPVITATGSGLVEIIQPPTLSGTTVIYVRDRQDPYFYSRYELELTGYPVYGNIPEPLAPFAVSRVTSSPGYSNNYPPANAVDGDLGTRWAAKGEHWIQFDLGESKPVKYVLIAYLNGDRTVYRFDLDVSEDAVSWKRVFTGGSSGKTSDLELIPIEETKARYIRLDGHGNNNDAWNNINELFIAGRSVATRLDVPAVDGVYSDTVHLHAKLTDTAGLPLSGKAVTFSVGDAVIGKAVTGEDGEARMDYRVTLGADAAAESKEYALKAEYAGQADQTFLASKAESELIVRKEQAELIYNGPLTASGQNAALSAQVRQQDDGEPGGIGGLPVQFQFKRYQKDGTAAAYVPPGLVPVSTNADGQAALSLPVPAGLYEVTGALAANPYYKEATSASVTVGVYSPGNAIVQANGHIDLPDNAAVLGSRAKKLHIESSIARSGSGGPTGTVRLHAEPQGHDLEIRQFDWLITEGGAAYVQGRAADEQGALYTVRLIMGTNQDAKGQANVLSVLIWKGNAAAGQPEVSLLAQPFQGSMQIK